MQTNKTRAIIFVIPRARESENQKVYAYAEKFIVASSTTVGLRGTRRAAVSPSQPPSIRSDIRCNRVAFLQPPTPPTFGTGASPAPNQRDVSSTILESSHDPGRWYGAGPSIGLGRPARSGSSGRRGGSGRPGRSS